MNKHMTIIFSLLFLLFQLISVYASDKIDVYFILSQDACTSCAQGAILKLKSEFTKIYDINKVNLLMNSSNHKYLKFLKKELQIDSVYLPDSGLKYFNNEKILSDYDIIFMQNNRVIRHFTDFTDLTILNYSKINSEVYPIQDNDSISIVNIGLPFIVEKKDEIYFISAEHNQLVCYNLHDKNFTKVYSMTHEDDYLFFDSTKHDKKYWDGTKQVSPRFCNYVSIYNVSDTSIQTINYGFYDYVIGGNVTGGKKLVWVKEPYISEHYNNKIYSYLITKPYDLFFKANKDSLDVDHLPGCYIIMQMEPVQLNKQIKAIITQDSLSHYEIIFVDYGNRKSFKNKIIDSLLHRSSDISVTSDGNNNLYITKFPERVLIKCHFDDSTCKVLNIGNIEQSNKLDTNKYVLKVFYNNQKIYVFWLYDECVTTEEYSADSLNFIRSYQLDLVNGKTNAFYDIAGFYKNKILVYTDDNDSNWILKMYDIGITK